MVDGIELRPREIVDPKLTRINQSENLADSHLAAIKPL